MRGQKHLLKTITRRKPAHGHNQQAQQAHGQSSSVGACVEVGKFGLEEEVEILKRDKNVISKYKLNSITECQWVAGEWQENNSK